MWRKYYSKNKDIYKDGYRIGEEKTQCKIRAWKFWEKNKTRSRYK